MVTLQNDAISKFNVKNCWEKWAMNIARGPSVL